MKFIRNRESFECYRCGHPVIGNGYTNHCSKCLFSRHVDIFPGDRAASCGGLMEPITVFVKNGEERILHQCILCGYERENCVADEDDREAVLAVMRVASDRIFKGNDRIEKVRPKGWDFAQRSYRRRVGSASS